MSDPRATDQPTEEATAPEAPAEAAPEAAPAPAPPSDEERVHELFNLLHLERTESTLATVWDWASRHFGLSRP